MSSGLRTIFVGVVQNVPQAFSTLREKNGLQQLLSDVSTNMAYLGAGVLLAFSAMVGYIAGGKAPGELYSV